MKTVIVTQGVEYIPNRNETRDFIDQKLIEFILASGLVPVPIPNFNELMQGSRTETEISIFNWINMISPTGFILSGGNDIGTQPARDFTEKTCLKYASKENLPVLGICRGMQMLAIWGSGSLVSVSNHVATRHRLSGSFEHEVNSYHSKGILSCPNDFQITARCLDGTIEAITHKTLSWQGWMWHPEREETFSQIDINNVKIIFCGK